MQSLRIRIIVLIGILLQAVIASAQSKPTMRLLKCYMPLVVSGCHLGKLQRPGRIAPTHSQGDCQAVGPDA